MPVALIVDDEVSSLSAMMELVEKEGFSALSAATLAEARDRLAQTRPDVVLADLMLPDGNGLELLQAMDSTPRPEFILITGYASVDSAVAALRVGVLDYLTKPVDIRRLKTALANVSRTLALKEEIGSLREELRELGRFTGATQLHRGYFERVSRGTLFLDEITEMPIELQVKLLRVLETGTLLRVGGDEPIAVDVRVIAASNRPPEVAVKEGKFREDLLYRLNVFPIVLPPLRDRNGDII